MRKMCTALLCCSMLLAPVGLYAQDNNTGTKKEEPKSDKKENNKKCKKDPLSEKSQC